MARSVLRQLIEEIEDSSGGFPERVLDDSRVGDSPDRGISRGATAGVIFEPKLKTKTGELYED